MPASVPRQSPNVIMRAYHRTQIVADGRRRILHRATYQETAQVLRQAMMRRCRPLLANMRALIAFVAMSVFASASCATAGRSAVESSLYHLPQRDVDAIKRVVGREPGIRKPIDCIDAWTADYATVESGPGLQPGEDIDLFHVKKVTGKWVIVPPVYEVVVTHRLR